MSLPLGCQTQTIALSNRKWKSFTSIGTFVQKKKKLSGSWQACTVHGSDSRFDIWLWWIYAECVLVIQSTIFYDVTNYEGLIYAEARTCRRWVFRDIIELNSRESFKG